MGYIVELNTLLRPPKNFDFPSLTIGKKYTVTLERERSFPLRIAILVIDQDWKFYGYCQALETINHNNQTTITFEMLTLFSLDEQKLYQQKFLEAGRKTQEA